MQNEKTDLMWIILMRMIKLRFGLGRHSKETNCRGLLVSDSCCSRRGKKKVMDLQKLSKILGK